MSEGKEGQMITNIGMRQILPKPRARRINSSWYVWYPTVGVAVANPDFALAYSLALEVLLGRVRKDETRNIRQSAAIHADDAGAADGLDKSIGKEVRSPADTYHLRHGAGDRLRSDTIRAQEQLANQGIQRRLEYARQGGRKD